MRQEELETLYRTWDNEKLLDLHQKSDDYSETVQMALHTVMRERKLKSRSKNVALAEPDETGNYMAMNIVSAHYLGLRILLYSFALSAFVILVVFVDEGGAQKSWVWTVTLIMMAMLVLAIWLSVHARAHFRFSREFNHSIFRLDQGLFSFVAHAPFSYFVYYTEVQYRYNWAIKATVPVLCLGITNEFNQTVILRGNLTAFDSAPPGWPHISQITLPENTRFYTELLFKRLNIQRLKRMLDEAHT